MTRCLLLGFALAAVTSAACGTSPASTATDGAIAPTAAARADQPMSNDLGLTSVSGVVAETMNSGGYTYARLTGEGGDTWMAAAEFAITRGATISAAVDMPMRDFHSRTLNRDFATIYFVRDVVMDGTPIAAVLAPPSAGEPPMVGSHASDAAADTPAPSGAALIAPVARAPGGLTVADIWAKRTALSGKPVVVRAQIVKVNLAIMGVNWYHVQDGSGIVADRTHDLVVTSAAGFQEGDVVTVSGVLATDKDFGAGYAYAAIVEGADIRK